MQKDYYLGLDLGTDSLGWAVTDLLYNILKYRGNAMWGIRLFDESQTAAKRRTFRTARRRLQRVRERLNLLEMIFDREISSIDLTFFQRLKESNLYLEDKATKSPYSIFTGDYTDKDFHKAYPTVFHLRKDLIENPKEHDIRLVFLALHHIIKSRGHFLYDTDGFGEANNFTAVFSEFSAYLKDNYEIELQCDSISTLEEVLKDRSLTKTKKIAKITPLFGITKKEPREYACLSLMCGAKVNLCDIFADDSLKEAEERSVTFSSGYDEKEALYEALLGERFELIEKIKSIYDWAVLADILDGEKYLSFAKVKSYEQHKSDLKELKRYVKAYKPREDYIRIFKTSAAGLNNYTAYSKHVKQNGKTGVVMQTCKQEDFCKFLKTTLGKCENEEYSDMFARIEAGTFMPKQITADNGVIPMQVHMAELIAILNNAKAYLPFLTQKDEEGYTPYDKIISVFGFRIPYYVGPLNKHSNKAWLVRSNEKITHGISRRWLTLTNPQKHLSEISQASVLICLNLMLFPKALFCTQSTPY